ncbi:MAG TPA: SDR family NAD(P)-dependent oxidoreductase, partial [Thermoanaerobaculia bacterium]|nr:SDR family NAD(P)-dependent oxidoreductase [Thermoanaerobaculia bacterium]
LALQHRQLPPTINFERLNEHIDLDDSPFYVNTRLQDWTVDGATRRQAAISSFGFSGTNAHMVIGEYQPAAIVKRPSHAGGDQIIPLSARTAAQLREKACDLLDFLRKEGRSLDLFDVAYTLQAGREPMDERLGLLVSSVEQLIEKLQAYVDGEQVGGLYEGQVRRNDETLSIISQDDDTKDALLERWISRRKLSKVLELWVNGLDLDWNRLHGEVKPRRIPLPLYPFAKEHYWIEATDAAATAVLHPLLHRNTSDFHRQSYRSTLRGDEFFLTDHQVRTGGNGIEKLLPGMAYLEMARAAIEHASGSNVMELQDTFWAQPIIVRESTEVTIALAADDSGRIDYEICSRDGDEEVVHFQGRASVSHRPAPAKLDLERLKTEMTHGRVEPGALYAACAHMGLMYGPAFHGVAAIHRGTDQVLAELRLPPSLESTVGDYFLHPSLMDSAVQAAAALVDGDVADEPRLPFALQSLSVFAPCSAEMVAWVRLAPGSRALDSTVKLDIDVCDVQGSVCVQLHGLSLRVSSPGQTAGSLPAIPIEQPESVANQELRQIYVDLSEGRLSRNEALERIKSFKLQQPAEGAGSLLATPVWEAADVQPSGGFAYAERHLIMCEAAAGDRDLAQRYGAHALACFERIRTILQAKPRAQVLVQIVVRDHEEQVLLTGLSALLATAALENPQLVGQLIVIPAGMSAEEMGRRLEEEKRGAANALVRYGQGGRQVRRWQEVPADPAKPPAAFEDRGVYLITGGLGGLGVLFAKEILRQTSDARVVLTGRGPEKRALLDGLGGRVSYRTVDVADRDQVEQLIAAIEQEHGRLNGILHCAGMLADNFIVKKDGAEFRNVLAPKVSGTFHLDEATRDLKLDFFVLFSSIAGAMGNVGQADYAAANGFMDQFAAYRNRLVGAGERHGRTRSINWPLWEAGGMGADAATAELLQQATGMQPMSTASGIDAFHRALAWPYDQLLVAEGDLARIRRALHAGRPAHTEPSVPAIAPVDGLVERTEEYLRRQCAELLKLPFQTIDPRAPLEKYGIDSILAMKLTGHLEKTFGSLSKTLFFEYQTIRELAGYFAQSHAPRLAALFGQPEAPAPVQSKPAAARRFAGRTREIRRERADEPVAIIGLSGRYPEAVDVEAYWNNLRDGKDCIIEVPKERWEWREYFSEDRSESGRHYSKWGGFIAGVDEFDALFFNISPKEAKGIDPQERLFLQHAWMAVEDAGYTRAGLQVPYESDLPGQVGVYAGVMYTEYQLFGAEARIGVAGSGASIANRVSYALNLHGPSMTLDTMCSSSLTAIHVACQDLKLGRTSLAIAGGVNVSIHPNKYLVLSGGQFISSDGRCESFGEGGDGYIPGEGVGVVLLKRLSDAERDGDHIYGVIRGSALNHGGKTNGYTVPNPQAQATAISRALAESHTDARHISYIEAHGTGTKLGDPIEIAALGKAFQRDTRETAFCLIGSAKSNIGHCESAAGIAGLTKVLLQIKHQQIAPSLHSAQLNPHIDFESTPFVVNQSLRPWEQPVIDGRTLPRIAGISSFGAGGSNAHLIVEEYQAPAAEPVAAGKVLILLSARTAEQLRQKAVDLLRFVASGTPELAAMAYTLQVGREAMEERLAVVIGTAEELREKLRAWVAGEQGIEDVHQGQVKRGNESLSAFSTDADLQQTVDKWIANGKLSKVADLWVKGLEVDWSKSHGDVQPRRVSLPAYPFARERHWVDVPAAAPAVVKSAAVLHPLLHSNTSVLGEQRYRSTFDGDEPFLTAEKVFPADTYLEMARAAIEHAVPERAESTFVELHDVSFGQPIVIEKDTRIEIALTPGDGDEIEFDIYSEDTILCQGRALFSRAPAPAEVVKP